MDDDDFDEDRTVVSRCRSAARRKGYVLQKVRWSNPWAGSLDAYWIKQMQGTQTPIGELAYVDQLESRIAELPTLGWWRNGLFNMFPNAPQVTPNPTPAAQTTPPPTPTVSTPSAPKAEKHFAHCAAPIAGAPAYAELPPFPLD